MWVREKAAQACALAGARHAPAGWTHLMVFGRLSQGQYQLLSWVAFRLSAIFRLVISLSFNSLFSLLGL
jgi:hypothetical protein